MTQEKIGMEFDEYCQAAAKTDTYPNSVKPWVYALGLTGKSGEVADKIKKVYRDGEGVFNAEVRKAIAKEIGDVLWYAARLAAALGYSLEQVARMNIAKLESRAKRGAIHGSGDER